MSCGLVIRLILCVSEDLCKKCEINKVIGTFNKQMMLIVKRLDIYFWALFNVTYMSGLRKVFSNIDFAKEPK